MKPGLLCGLTLSVLLFMSHSVGVITTEPPLRECTEDPPVVEHASHNDTAGPDPDGTRVRYECDEAYSRRGFPLAVCSEGKWHLHPYYPMKCTIKSCGYPGDIANGKFNNYQFSVGSEVTYSCHPGYEVVGRATLLCLANAEWTDNPPSCRRVKCPPLRRPSHGTAEVTGREYESRATLTCQEGYKLSGSSERTCQADRTWSGEETICTKITCERPSIDFGYVQVSEEIEYGTIATFSCEEGRTLVGVKTSGCKDINEWSQDIPRCVDKCTIPTISNGRVRERRDWAWNYRCTNVGPGRVEQGATLYISCCDGYRLSLGRYTWTSITCTDGVWGDLPTCDPIPCVRTPSQLANGWANVEDPPHVHGDMVNYTCDAGYSLSGASERTCRNGKWTNRKPTCREDSCSVPKITNGKLQRMTGTYVWRDYVSPGTRLRVKCDFGYKPTGGSREVRCSKGYLEQLPTCDKIPCTEKPQQPANGHARVEGLLHGDKVHYTCDPGYSLNGVSKTTCRNSKWTSDPPRCTEKPCVSPEKPENGVVNITGLNSGSVAVYQCDTGFTLQGRSRRDCVKGNWTGLAPQCVERDCVFEPSRLEQVSPNGKKFTPGSGIQVSCKYKDLYVLANGTSKATCDRGEWNPATPECIGKPCRTHSSKANATIRYGGDESTRYGWNGFQSHDQIAVLECDDGFDLVGEGKQTCKFGNWKESELGSCQPKSCSLPDKNIRQVQKEEFKHGDRQRFACKEGYHFNETDAERLTGEIEGECQFGKWAPHDLKCHPDPCKLTGLDNVEACVGRLRCEHAYSLNHNVTATLSCRRGFRWENTSQDDPVVTCELGQLDIDVHNLSKCTSDGSGCKDPGHSENADRFASRDTTGGVFSPDDTLTYKCLPGYEIDAYVTSQTITCNGAVNDIPSRVANETSSGALDVTPRGRWSSPPPACKAVQCDPPFGAERASFLPEKDLYDINDTVAYTCDDGLTLKGSAMQSCQPNGTWSPTEPECINDKQCDPPRRVDGGSFRPIKNMYDVGDTVNFTCDNGRKLQGSAILSCRRNRFWSSSEPRCIEDKRCRVPAAGEGIVSTYQKGEVNLTLRSGDLAASGTLMVSRCSDDKYSEFWGAERRLCLNGDWQGAKPTCVRDMVPDVSIEDKSCRVPPAGEGVMSTYQKGEVSLTLRSGDLAASGTLMVSRCSDDKYLEFRGAERRLCLNGDWQGAEPTCVREPDVLTEEQGCAVRFLGENIKATYRDDKGRRLSLYSGIHNAPPGTQMLTRCKTFNGYVFRGDHRRVCRRGQWGGEAPSCEKYDFETDGVPNAYLQAAGSGYMRFDDDGGVLVWKRTTVDITCQSQRHLQWRAESGNIADTQGIRIGRERRFSQLIRGRWVWVYLSALQITNADDHHSDTYSCEGQGDPSHSRQFRILVDG